MAKIDVFFIHPTLYLKGNRWNADIHNKNLNKEIGNSAIKNQASVFLGIANIYAPHYRQMHIQSYYDLENGLQAYDVAYLDVKNAFMYYWKYYNKGNIIYRKLESKMKSILIKINLRRPTSYS